MRKGMSSAWIASQILSITLKNTLPLAVVTWYRKAASSTICFFTRVLSIHLHDDHLPLDGDGRLHIAQPVMAPHGTEQGLGVPLVMGKEFVEQVGKAEDDGHGGHLRGLKIVPIP